MPVAALFFLTLAFPKAVEVDFGSSVADRVRLLHHENPGVRMEAAELLARAPADQVIAALLNALSDPDPGVRAAVAQALAVQGDERAVPFLAQRLRDEPSPEVVARDLVAIGRCGGPYVARRVVPFLDHPARVVRIAAIEALGRVGDAGQRDALWAALRYAPDDPQFRVRAAVLGAFVSLGWTDDVRAAIRELRREGAERFWFSRATIQAAIGAAHLKELEPTVVHALDHDPDPRVVAAAAQALARLGKTDAVAARLTSDSVIVRYTVLAALRDAGDPRAVEKARTLVRDDPDASVRFEAALVLFDAKDPMADAYLVDALNAKDPHVWISALQALEGRYGKYFGRNPKRWTEWLKKRHER